MGAERERAEVGGRKRKIGVGGRKSKKEDGVGADRATSMWKREIEGAGWRKT